MDQVRRGLPLPNQPEKEPGNRVGSSIPHTGELVWICRRASVQFDGDQAFWARMIRALDIPTYHGWAWLDVYQVNEEWNAIDRRRILVQIDGLRPGRQTAPRAGGRRW